MTFSTLLFLFLFLPFTLVMVYLAKPSYRNSVLLFASLFFYTWGEHAFVFLLLATIVVNFLLAKWIEQPGRFFTSKSILVFSIAFNLGIIVYFKYFNFLSENAGVLLQLFHITVSSSILEVVLPVGLSFFTFQNISYNLDVYWKKVKAEEKLLNYALYISFFPHLVAGPIVRYADIAQDIVSSTLSYPWVVSGIKRFILGLSKKVLIANTMAFVADEIFKLPQQQLNTPLAWLALSGYTLQIYFDFSGYSDMAIGLSRMFGFNFHENFNFPYIATSVTDFWRRWHISLSLWFRDYVYIPLGGNRKGKFRVIVNLLIVFFLTGLWHGASWNFIIWGMIHGFFMLIELIGNNKVPQRLGRPLAHVYCLMVVMLAWVFFRIEDSSMALKFIGSLFGLNGYDDTYSAAYFLTPEVILMLIAGILFSIPLTTELVARFKLNPYLVNMIYILLLLLSIFGLSAGTYNPFIYSKF